MKRIFVDMDGVLCDFDKHYFEMFGVNGLDLRKAGKDKEYRRNWKAFVSSNGFAFLDYHEGAQKLISFLHSLDVEKVILSSSAGYEFYETIREQKVFWLKRHNIDWTPIVVPGKKYKKGFADANSFLIDDTWANIDDFEEAGGKAILHSDVDVTIGALRNWLQLPEITI
jgi:hypothetical protein